MITIRRLVPGIAILFLLAGCATVSAKTDFSGVQKTVASRTEARVHWNQGGPEDAAVAQAIESTLGKELTVEAAVQLALLNNRTLQATFEELGIAQADLVQAGLLKNPVFAGHVRFSDQSGQGTNTEFSVSQDFMELFARSLRKKVAAAQLESVQFRVSDAVLKLSAEVRLAYYALQGAEHSQKSFETIVQAAQAAVDLAERQHTAGNSNDLEFAGEQAAFQQANLDLIRSQAELLSARERLNRLIGLTENPSWTISEIVPAMPSREPSGETLEQQALSQRLDLLAARNDVHASEQVVDLARRGAWPAVNIGVDTERDPDGTRVTGPSWEAELPVFDQKQTPVARAQAQLRQNQNRVAALETQIRSEVRASLNHVQVSRQLIDRYRDEMIPLREKIVAETQKHYNFMLKGAFQLLQAKRDELNAYREYMNALQDYWQARTDLERAVGGRLPVSESSPIPMAHPAEPKQEAAHHHHH